MTPVVVALGGVDWEPDLVAALHHPSAAVEVSRRCVSALELVTVAATTSARCALVAVATGLDNELVMRLRSHHVAVVGIAASASDEDEFRRIGVTDLVLITASDVASASREIAATVARVTTADGPTDTAGSNKVVVAQRHRGRLVAVWGPPGSPGRSSVAIGFADESAALGITTLLVDADTRAPSLSILLGVVDEVSGLGAATRRGDVGRLDVAELAGCARTVASNLRLLSGVSRPSRWHEVRPAGLDQLWRTATTSAALTVVDVGGDLDALDELDRLSPKRGGAGVSAIEQADLLVAVCAAEPLSLTRLAQALPAVQENWPHLPIRIVVTRARASAVGGHPIEQVTDALRTHLSRAPDQHPTFISDDRAGYDEAVREGRTLRESSPNSAARRDLERFTRDVCGQLLLLPEPHRARGWRRRSA